MKKSDDLFLIGLDVDCTASRLQEILQVNPKTWHDLVGKGVLPVTGSYKEFLVPLFQYYFKQNEVALEKVKLKQETSESKSSSKGENYEKLLEAQILQKIRLDQANEERLYISNLKERNQVLLKGELKELLSPILRNMANILRAASDAEPKLQSVIDKVFESLYKFGEILAFQVEEDKNNYVKAMLARPVDIDKIKETTELPEQND